jgi:ketosteroid isomerase-like protein
MMKTADFNTTILVDRSPEEVFNAINDVRGWWSGEIEGSSRELNDEFTYRYQDMHYSKQKLVEMIPGKKVVWLVTDSKLTFVTKENEWTNTRISFDISQQGEKTQIRFTHQGLTPAAECFDDCSNGWTHYLQHSLRKMIMNGHGNKESNIMATTNKTGLTTGQVAARFNELAKQEKWFEIQDELFADNVKSIDPPNSPYLGYAEGKAAVRKKGEDWVKRIEAVHRMHTTEPVIGGNHFAVGREMDTDVQGLGRVQINEIMLYEVKDGKIVSERFFY